MDGYAGMNYIALSILQPTFLAPNIQYCTYVDPYLQELYSTSSDLWHVHILLYVKNHNTSTKDVLYSIPYLC